MYEELEYEKLSEQDVQDKLSFFKDELRRKCRMVEQAQDAKKNMAAGYRDQIKELRADMESILAILDKLDERDKILAAKAKMGI